MRRAVGIYCLLAQKYSVLQATDWLIQSEAARIADEASGASAGLHPGAEISHLEVEGGEQRLPDAWPLGKKYRSSHHGGRKAGGVRGDQR